MINVEIKGVSITIQVVRAVDSQEGSTILFKGPLEVLKNYLKDET